MKFLGTSRKNACEKTSMNPGANLDSALTITGILGLAERDLDPFCIKILLRKKNNWIELF